MERDISVGIIVPRHCHKVWPYAVIIKPNATVGQDILGTVNILKHPDQLCTAAKRWKGSLLEAGMINDKSEQGWLQGSLHCTVRHLSQTPCLLIRETGTGAIWTEIIFSTSQTSAKGSVREAFTQ